MSYSSDVAGATAFAVVNPGPGEIAKPIVDMLVIGRECSGIDDLHRLILDDETVSRRHAEIRLDLRGDRAYVFDTSTNGTRLNGARVESTTDVVLKPGDILILGSTRVEFRSDRFGGRTAPPAEEGAARSTMRAVSTSTLSMVAGDVIGYEAISQYTGEDELIKSIDGLYEQLAGLLARHQGVLSSYVADAFFGTWDVAQVPDAAGAAVAFALEASRLVDELAPRLPLRTPDDEPIRMGWGVAMGNVAVSALAGSRQAVIGDATNVAFQLASVAGRDGRPLVVASGAVANAVAATYQLTAPEELLVKGRIGSERIFGVLPSI